MENEKIINDNIFGLGCPLISVVISSKNRHSLVLDAVASVIDQALDNVEIIVVDDCSEPPLKSVLYEKFHDKVFCLRNETSLGGACARNRGAQFARGEYIAFLDDDDIWLPNKLAKQIDVFANNDPDVGVVYCGFDLLVNEQVVSRKNYYHPGTDLRTAALWGCPFGSPTPLIRKDLFEMVGGFDDAFPSCQDWDLWIRLSKVCKFLPVMESLALYRVHGDQISTDIFKKIDGRKKILAKYFDDISCNSRLLSAHYRRIGSLCAIADAHIEARKYFHKALLANVYDVGCLVHLLLTFVSKSIQKKLIYKYGIQKIDCVKIID